MNFYLIPKAVFYVKLSILQMGGNNTCENWHQDIHTRTNLTGFQTYNYVCMGSNFTVFEEYFIYIRLYI